MTRHRFLAATLAACVLAVGGCATPRAGAAEMSLGADGAITLTPRSRGLFGTGVGEAVVFRPGEPGYAAVRAQLEAVQSGAKKPVLSWSFGEPVVVR